MSRDIRVQFEVRDMLIMKNTLELMGYNYRELGTDVLGVSSPSHASQDIVVDGNAGVITAAPVDSQIANKIKQTYTAEVYRDQIIQEGNQIHEETNNNGEIRILIS